MPSLSVPLTQDSASRGSRHPPSSPVQRAEQNLSLESLESPAQSIDEKKATTTEVVRGAKYKLPKRRVVSVGLQVGDRNLCVNLCVSCCAVD